LTSDTIAVRRRRAFELTSPALLGAAALFVALVAVGVALRTPWLPIEEAGAVQGARDLGAEPARAGLLWQVLLWLPAHLLSAGAFLGFAKIVATLAWVALAVPSHALGRRCGLDRTAAAVVAALSVLCCGSVCATTILPDTIALLLAVGALAAAAHDRRGFALGLAVAAALTRPWLAPLAPALLWALASHDQRVAVRRWPGAVLFAVAAGAVYAAYALSDAASFGALVRAGMASLGLAALAVGVVPGVAAWGATSPLRRLLGPAVLAAGLSGALAGGGGPVRAEDRASLFVVPLVLALAATALRGLDRRRARIAAWGVTALVVPLPWPLPEAEGGVLTGALWRHVHSHPLLIVVVAALAFLPLYVRPSRALAVGAALLVAASAAAWSDAAHRSHDLRLGVPLPRSQLDDAVGRGAHVVWALTGNADPNAVAEAQLWNRSLRRVVRVDPATADPTTGVLDERSTEYALGAVPIVGEQVATIPLGTVSRVNGPLRAAELVSGLYPDGWSGFQTTYTRLAGPKRNSTLAITVSRKTWTGPDKPAQVSADAAPIGGQPFAERVTTIHGGETTTLRVPVPPPPFQVTVRVSPTFSPAELGAGSDTRQLGALLTFAYPTR
jgi:hypothetical protein